MPKKPITIADIVRIFGECEIQDERGIWLPFKVEEEDSIEKNDRSKQNTYPAT